MFLYIFSIGYAFLVFILKPHISYSLGMTAFFLKSMNFDGYLTVTVYNLKINLIPAPFTFTDVVA